MSAENNVAWKPPGLPRIFLLYFFIVLASCFDAWMTLEFIARGGAEMNPYVIPMIEAGTVTFLIWKLAVGACAGLLLYFGARRWRWVWIAFNLVALIYVLLTALHIVLLIVL